jgi:hypothetical protein
MFGTCFLGVFHVGMTTTSILLSLFNTSVGASCVVHTYNPGYSGGEDRRIVAGQKFE